MTQTLAALILLFAACEDPGTRETHHDARIPDAPPVDAYEDPDAAPPPFDAAALPETACAPADASVACPLPPSTCLDANYLIYYTDGSCVDDKCRFTENWLYCYTGCVPMLNGTPSAGCQFGFT